MLKISRKASCTISTVLAYILLAAMTALIFVMPYLTRLLVNLPDLTGQRENIGTAGRIFILCDAYFILLFGLFADLLLISILRFVRKDSIFTLSTVARLRALSWAIIAVGAGFLALFYYFQFALFVGFIAIFVGLCLRVVKNCFEDAVAIKLENDLTV